MTIELREAELYQEIEIFSAGVKVGEMEVDLKDRMLSRLAIYDPCQDKGIGSEAVRLAVKRYGCRRLWVRADNDRAVHVYEKAGFVRREPTMYLMEAAADEQQE